MGSSLSARLSRPPLLSILLFGGLVLPPAAPGPTDPGCRTASAQILTYPDPCLYSLYPVGGQQGQTVELELRGAAGFETATGLVIDGPPGIEVTSFETTSGSEVRASLVIAADARPGRRRIRVAGASASGLTNFREFFVGTLPEIREAEANNTLEAAQEVSTPAVINGQIERTLDVDCYRFQGRAGEQLVAAVLAYGLDCFTNIRGGYLDTSLELLTAEGRVLASSEDAQGLDPLIELQLPADDEYVVRVRSLGFKGSVHAVYRLTLGEVPYPTAVFPAGGRRGEPVEVELSGPGIPPGTRQLLADASAGFLLQRAMYDGPASLAESDSPPVATDLPFIRGELPEAIEQEPNDSRETASPATLPVTFNGRFLEPGDEDWVRLTLTQGQQVLLETLAQRHLRSPVDTQIAVFSSSGQQLSINDDGGPFQNGIQCAHDFRSTDSFLTFRAPAAGEYFVQVSNRAGTSGPQSVYRLTIRDAEPEFFLYQWPDAVPVWGPGSSAAFVVELIKWGGLTEDIQVAVEGLPEGWSGSVANWPTSWMWAYNERHAVKLLVTITAPADAPVGQIVPFRVIGRTKHEGRLIEREAQYGTLYGSGFNDRMLVRASPAARAVVAPPQDCRLETDITELTAAPGSTIEIPVRIIRFAEAGQEQKPKQQLGLVVNGGTVAAGVGLTSPVTLEDGVTEFRVPLTVSLPEGTHSILVARTWSSDIRAGRPGPCTRLIRLHVRPPAAGE